MALAKSLFSPTQPTPTLPRHPPHPHIRNVFTALSSNRSLTVTTVGLRFLGKIPALGSSGLKGSDCCEAGLFSSRPRATAGGEIINTAGKVNRVSATGPARVSPCRRRRSARPHLSALASAKRLMGKRGASLFRVERCCFSLAPLALLLLRGILIVLCRAA